MKYYLIAGEASGDLHGSNLMKAIRQLDPDARFRFWGGDAMQAVEPDALVKHIRDLAFMGFVEVLMHLPEIMSNIRFCKQDIRAMKPDVVVLIDYPGFNFRLLAFLKEQGIPVVYYISPQLWAWKKGRIQQVKKYVDIMIPIFPFEEVFYRQNGIEAKYLGHPLKDALPEPSVQQQSSKIIALLPGSRKQEIRKMLPVFLDTVSGIEGYTAVVAGMSLHGRAYYEDLAAGRPMEIEIDRTHDLLGKSRAALVTSGTATLEACLMNVPQLIAYRGNPLSFMIGKWLVDVPFIGMVNLIAQKEVCKEFLQDDCTADKLRLSLLEVLDNYGRNKQLEEYEVVREKLGPAGASDRAAEAILKLTVSGR